MKTCSRCQQEKALTEFRKERSATSGWGATCSRCIANDQRRRYHQNGGREKQHARRKALIAERYILIERLKDVPCTDCCGRFPRVCMDFDHVRGEKIESISRMIRMSYSWESVLAEIEKCEVVCSNCHRIRTAARGQWHGAELEGAV